MVSFFAGGASTPTNVGDEVAEMTINEKLARWMKETGTTQATASAATGLAQATISGMVNGVVKKPGGDVVVAIAELMQCDLEWLLSTKKGWPMKRAGAAQPDPITDEQREILQTA